MYLTQISSSNSILTAHGPLGYVRCARQGRGAPHALAHPALSDPRRQLCCLPHSQPLEDRQAVSSGCWLKGGGRANKTHHSEVFDVLSARVMSVVCPSGEVCSNRRRGGKNSLGLSSSTQAGRRPCPAARSLFFPDSHIILTALSLTP